MRQAHHTLEVQTRGRGMTDVTEGIAAWLHQLEASDGLLTLFLRHTSASLLLQENADPLVQKDLEAFFARLVPDGDGLFQHVAEGTDDMPAHVRAALTQTSLAIPIQGGRLALGTWQGIYLYEHRRAPHARQIVLHYLGS